MASLTWNFPDNLPACLHNLFGCQLYVLTCETPKPSPLAPEPPRNSNGSKIGNRRVWGFTSLIELFLLIGWSLGRHKAKSVLGKVSTDFKAVPHVPPTMQMDTFGSNFRIPATLCC
eukprot:3057970-Amphidinium_carterae.1